MRVFSLVGKYGQHWIRRIRGNICNYASEAKKRTSAVVSLVKLPLSVAHIYLLIFATFASLLWMEKDPSQRLYMWIMMFIDELSTK